MNTKILKITDPTAISETCEVLRTSGVIVFPTETVYGIGADLYNESAVKRIFSIKNRPLNKPLSAHIGSLNSISELVEYIPDEFYVLSEKFLPGPLAIILKKSKIVPNIVTAGLNTIGIRLPDFKPTIDLINEYGFPLVGTSVNISSQMSLNDVNEIYNEFKGDIDLIFDGGKPKYCKESTVISLVEDPPKIYRVGVIPPSEIEAVLKKKVITS